MGLLRIPARMHLLVVSRGGREGGREGGGEGGKKGDSISIFSHGDLTSSSLPPSLLPFLPSRGCLGRDGADDDFSDGHPSGGDRRYAVCASAHDYLDGGTMVSRWGGKEGGREGGREGGTSGVGMDRLQKGLDRRMFT